MAGQGWGEGAGLELVPDALVAVNELGEIVIANARAERLFGFTSRELVGRPVEMLLPDRYTAAHRGHRLEYFAEPSDRLMNAGRVLRGCRSDGSEFRAEVTICGGEVEGTAVAVASIRDVSPRARRRRSSAQLVSDAERERLLAHVEHARRLESLGELAGGIAHDFNNLLAVIINYAAFVAEDLGGRKLPPGEEELRATRADVEQISLAAEQAARLTHQLLTFSRREAAHAEVADVNAAVRAVGQLLKRALGEHVELRYELAEDLRPILIDIGQLEAMLVNLTVNARDAMPDGGTVTIDTANVQLDEDYTSHRPELSPGMHVRLRVSDDGRGMSRQVAERAFDPFFSTKPSGRGTGLGLATVYGIVQQASGRARIYSEAGVGTTFTALFPATEQAAVPPAPVDPALARGEGTILLVEDDAALREVSRRILAGAGYAIIVASNGREALAAAEAHADRVDLLLTDVVMPEMQGRTLAQEIERLQPATPVIFMSGFAESVLDLKGGLPEGTSLIEKPFSSPSLLGAVSRALSGAAARH